MEKYLMQLYEKDGVAIFHTDYELMLKLLNEFSKGSLRNDAYCIQALLSGNAFYKSIVEALKTDNHEVSMAEYNVFVAQACSSNRFWKSDSSELAHLENLLRMLYKVAGVNIVGLPEMINCDEATSSDNGALVNEMLSAEFAYDNKNYLVALEKSNMLFNKGVATSATILGKAYFYGHGTRKDYNKALFYLTYPHWKSRQQDKEERYLLERLLELRDKSMYSAIICLFGSVLALLFMLVSGFFSEHLVFSLFNTALLVVGGVLFVITYKKKLIFDFSYWFLILGCIILATLIL